MSESNNNGNDTGPTSPSWEVEIPVPELDRSCRVPVLFMFGKAAGWLLLGSLLALLNSIRFHSPDLLAHCPWLTFGRIQPAASFAFVYGFALQAAFAVALWMLVRLGRTTLVQPGFVVLGAGFWNLGALVGLVGILMGDSTSYAYFELPKYAAPILFVAYSIIGGLGLVTFQRRHVKQLYISQWFLLAALLWFPWIFSAASLLLHYYPVRGVAQVAIAGWYGTGLTTMVLGGVVLAALFYLVPKILRKPLHSYHMGLFAFWLILFFGGGAGVLSGSTVPSWISGLSAVMSFFVAFAAIAIAVNWFNTIGEDTNRLFEPDLKFLAVSAVAFILVAFLNAANAYSGIAEVTQFTLVLPALQQLNLGAFIMLGLFGAGYYLLPRVAGASWSKPGLVGLHFFLALGGVGLTVAVLGFGGLMQGQSMADPTIPFVAVTKSLVYFLRVETVGSLLLLGSSLVFLVNVGTLSCQSLCCGEGGILACLSGDESTRVSEAQPVSTASAPSEESDSKAAVKRPASKSAPKKAVAKKAVAKKKAPAAKKKQAKKAAKK